MESNSQTFYPFYEGRISRVTGVLKKECPGGNLQEGRIWESIAVSLHEVFHRASVRCLIVELHVCKAAGLLSGENSREKYLCYCSLLKDEQYVGTIYGKYPGLHRYLKELEEIQLCFWRELLGRLVNDWDQIKAYFQMEPDTRIRDIRRSGSDFHCRGRSVVIVETDRNKEILYKPHSLENEIFLQGLLADIHTDLGMGAFRYLELERGGYGWVEKVVWQECASLEEVSAFYKRAGVLMAVAYVLGIGDLHYENIIAHGGFPVVVDAETLFQHMGTLYRWTERTRDFYSVLSSGLLPGGAADLDTAGVTGGVEGALSGRMPVILNDKTSEICVGYGRSHMSQGKNYVRYLGKRMPWEDYGQEVAEGFRLGYGWFGRNREEVFQRVRACKDRLRSRYVSGNSQFFGLGIFASVHGTLMESEKGRYEYLRKLCGNRRLGAWEAQAMAWGDIPCFSRRLDDGDVYCGQEAVVWGFFQETIEEQLRARMQQLSEEDCKLQEQVIAFTYRLFGTGAEKKKEKTGMDAVCPPDRSLVGLAGAEKIGMYMLRHAIREGEKIFWLGADGEEGRLKVKPVDIYFYGGIAGIAVFFRKLYRASGRYGDICGALEGMLFSYTDRISSGEGCPVTEDTGMYCGEGSVAYAYQLLYEITRESRYRRYACIHVKIMCRYISRDRHLDLTYGNAGAVLVLCQQYRDTGDEAYLREAQNALSYLENRRLESGQGVTWIEKAEGSPVCSLAHGNSGMLLAYARMESLVHNGLWGKRMRQIMAYEDQYYREEYGNWADLRREKGQWETYAWCNGGMGVVYARLLAKKWNPEELADVDIGGRSEVLARKLAVRGDMCLCHGNMGNLLILREMVGELGKREDVVRQLGRLENALERFVRDLDQEKGRVDFGFMNGVSGVGCGCFERCT